MKSKYDPAVLTVLADELRQLALDIHADCDTQHQLIQAAKNLRKAKQVIRERLSKG